MARHEPTPATDPTLDATDGAPMSESMSNEMRRYEIRSTKSTKNLERAVWMSTVGLPNDGAGHLALALEQEEVRAHPQRSKGVVRLAQV